MHDSDVIRCLIQNMGTGNLHKQDTSESNCRYLSKTRSSGETLRQVNDNFTEKLCTHWTALIGFPGQKRGGGGAKCSLANVSLLYYGKWHMQYLLSMQGRDGVSETMKWILDVVPSPSLQGIVVSTLVHVTTLQRSPWIYLTNHTQPPPPTVMIVFIMINLSQLLLRYMYLYNIILYMYMYKGDTLVHVLIKNAEPSYSSTDLIKNT